jgi:hypothetical protein
LTDLLTYKISYFRAGSREDGREEWRREEEKGGMEERREEGKEGE